MSLRKPGVKVFGDNLPGGGVRGAKVLGTEALDVKVRGGGGVRRAPDDFVSDGMSVNPIRNV